MASASSVGNISHYFKKGADIEVSCDDEGFRGSLYAGTVIRPPARIRSNAKVLVEYKTLMEDEKGKRPLKEELELVQLRPAPPQDNRSSFKFNEEVDAYYNDGWWEGVITEVKGNDKYSVFFRGTREQLNFKASELRVHREWISGRWFPPLEPSPEDTTLKNKKRKQSSVAELEASAEIIEHDFSPGELVEVSSDEKGLEDAWFAATVIKKLRAGKYLIEYQALKDEDSENLLREEVSDRHMRPSPPDVGLVDRFEVREEIDALYNDAWWLGVVKRVLHNDRYTIYFKRTDEELKFNHSDLRVHQEWRNGKWAINSKVL